MPCPRQARSPVPTLLTTSWRWTAAWLRDCSCIEAAGNEGGQICFALPLPPCSRLAQVRGHVGNDRLFGHLDAEHLGEVEEHGVGIVGAQSKQQIASRHADVDHDVAQDDHAA